MEGERKKEKNRFSHFSLHAGRKTKIKEPLKVARLASGAFVCMQLYTESEQHSAPIINRVIRSVLRDCVPSKVVSHQFFRSFVERK